VRVRRRRRHPLCARAAAGAEICYEPQTTDYADDYWATYARIAPQVRRTPIVAVDAADFDLPRAPLCLKLEHMQYSGSFKVRGAFANLLLRAVLAEHRTNLTPI
jgi:threonine dehydratase